jgi:hypothetical protein
VLLGGGSGIAVFAGSHPELGDIVMKHGDFKDLKESYALATIAEELKKRGERNSRRSKEAALSMKSCLPEFKMIYISPQHVLLKKKELWGKLRHLVKIGGYSSKISSANTSSDSLGSIISKKTESVSSNKIGGRSAISSSSSSLSSLSDSTVLTPGTSIRIYERDQAKAAVHLNEKTKMPSLAIILPKKFTHCIDSGTVESSSNEEFDCLKQVYKGLSGIMRSHLFKFTLAQKRIGGTDAKTGSQCLYEGKLHGSLLANLISKFVETVHNLQQLTLLEEVDVADQVRAEVRKLEADPSSKADSISHIADQFMGNAIKKNFHPTKGRILFFKQSCEEFRKNEVFLIPEEKLPAKHLGRLMESGTFMSDVFVGASSEPPMIKPSKNFWINLMGRAVDERKCMSPNALKQIWTSGLADAGIHNLFLNESDVFFFDLGEPQLQSIPGFMTKFLFSIFHVLGMQETDDGEWVRRFVPQKDKLGITKETTELLADAYDAYEVCMNRIIDEIFDGDQGLRWLLTQYVTAQLLSDAAFCLQRWKMKGGSQSREQNHNTGIERWLWRALWDSYVAFDINTKESWHRLKVEHPSCNASTSKIRESIRWSICSSRSSRENSLLRGITTEEETRDKFNENKQLSSPKSAIERRKDTTKSGVRGDSMTIHTSRWPSARLSSLSSLRDLSVANFEYNSDDTCDLDEDEDDDENKNESDLNSSATIPEGSHNSDASRDSPGIHQ